MNNSRVIAEGVYESSEDQLDLDTASEFASFIDDMNSTESADAWITVMRIPTDARGQPMPNSKHLGQLFNEPLGSSTINDVIERIRREFIRPGESSITVRIIGKQAGQRGIKFNRIYTVEKPNTTAKGEPGTPLTELGNMLLQMQRASDERAERLERLLAGNAAVVRPAESFADQLVKLAPAIAALTPILQTVLGRAPAAGGGPAEMLATVRALKEASNLFGGNSGGDGGDTLSTVKAVAEAIGPGLKFLALREENAARNPVPQLPAPTRAAPPPVRPKAVPPKAPVQPARKPATPPQGAPNNQQEVDEMELKALREQIEVIAAMCDEGQKPEDVAVLIVNNVTDEQLDELYRRVEPENFVAQMKTLCSKAITGRELWFEKLRAEIMNQYEADPDAEESDTPATGAAQVNGQGLADSPVDLDAIPDAGGNS